MRHAAICPLCLVLLARFAHAEPPAALPAPVPEAAAPAPTLRSRIGDEAIRKAVKETLAESWENPRRHENDTVSATLYEQFGRELSEATVPDCLHSEGLKRQPTFFLNGLLALPFIAVAKIRGKCK